MRQKMMLRETLVCIMMFITIERMIEVWEGLLSTWHSYPGLHTSVHNCGKMLK